jgi:hypothetical protein
VRFQGVISGKRLSPGSYTLQITATAAGQHVVSATLHFTIATTPHKKHH